MAYQKYADKKRERFRSLDRFASQDILAKIQKGTVETLCSSIWSLPKTQQHQHNTTCDSQTDSQIGDQKSTKKPTHNLQQEQIKR
jgi:hypothetical protein